MKQQRVKLTSVPISQKGKLMSSRERFLTVHSVDNKFDYHFSKNYVCCLTVTIKRAFGIAVSVERKLFSCIKIIIIFTY